MNALPKTDALQTLTQVVQPILHLLSWRRRRDASLAIFEALKPLLGETVASAVAQSMTDVAPKRLLTVSEARRELNRLGVRKGKQFLYRLAVKARNSAGPMTIFLNADGDWNGSTTSTHRPVARVVVHAGLGIHFEVTCLLK